MRRLLLVTGIVIFFASFTGTVGPYASAEGSYQWAPVERIEGYAADTPAPFLVADQSRTVHAFTSQLVKNVAAVVYRQWTLDQGWTAPVDVLLPPEGGQARVAGAHLDREGTMHVAFFGGNDQALSVYYSRAAAVDAGRAPSWSPPVLIGRNAGPVTDAALAGDVGGNLFILYPGRQTGNGLYAVRSADSGASWSEPSVVYQTYSLRRLVGAIQGYIDSAKRLHVVWTVNDDFGNGEAIYYTKLESDLVTWSTPILLATRTSFEADSASIIEHDGELIVVYHEGQPAKRWMRRSTDGGQTWSYPVRPFTESWVGTYGPAILLQDSGNTLHMILGNRRAGGPETRDIHGMWHSIWQGGRWSALESIISGSRVEAGHWEPFDPSAPRATISQGNVLLATWVTDPGAGRNGVWYSFTRLDAPELPIAPLPTPALKPTAVTVAKPEPRPEAVTVPTPGRSPLPTPYVQVGSASEMASNDNPQVQSATTFAPVALLIVAVVAWKLFDFRRRS